MLTLDNTTKQNKGRFLAGFLTLLVRQGVFEETYMMYLPVGHTHDLVDQMFSRFAVHLRTNNALSRGMLAKCIKNSYTDKFGRTPKVVQWEAVANVSGWMEAEGVKELKGVLKHKWRKFKFSKIKGRTVMQVRDNLRKVRGDDWRGIKEGQPFYNVFEGCEEGGLKFVEGCQTGTMPPAQRTDPMQSQKPITIENRKSRWAKRRKNLDTIFRDFPFLFSRKHYDDCLAILDLEESQEPVEWHWDPNAVEALMGDKDVVEHSDDDDDDDDDGGSDSDDEAALHPWAGHALPAAKKVYVVRSEDGHDNLSFKLYKVQFRCERNSVTRFKYPRGYSGLKLKTGEIVPEGTKDDDEDYADLWYACEELVLEDAMGTT